MSTTRNQNDDDGASSRKRVKTCDNGMGPWSDLNHHVLHLVMMKLGVVDYLSFGGVCKSWRSLAISERNIFLGSKPPMTLHITWCGDKKICCLENLEGRKIIKSIFRNFTGGVCVGLTCGYLIFFWKKTHDFRLVNPITRHNLYFPPFPDYHYMDNVVRVIIVFSLSVSRWVFLVTHKYSSKIWFSIAGTGIWNHVSCTSYFSDLRAFKGKIYALNFNSRSRLCELYELRLKPEPKLTLLETKNSLSSCPDSELVSSGENIYVMDRVPPNGYTHMIARTPNDRYRFQELDFEEMKWVSREKTLGEYASFLSNLKHGVVVKRVFGERCGEGLLVGHKTGEKLKLMDVKKASSYGIADKRVLDERRWECCLLGRNTGDELKLAQVKKASSFTAKMWYLPHECLNVNQID